MRRTLIITLLAAMVLAAGCNVRPGGFDPRANMPPPIYPPQDMRLAQPSPGSLFNARRSDLFTDLRASQVGDIITVLIVENAKAKKKSDTKAERGTSLKAGIPYLLGYSMKDLPVVKSDAKAATLLEATFSNKHDAKGELSKEDSMTASIGCTVMEVFPNGNLFVRGSREIQVNGETQYIILQGTVRATDVTADNTVLSTQLADARIHYTGRGVLTDKQQPGWLSRLIDVIWPF